MNKPKKNNANKQQQQQHKRTGFPVLIIDPFLDRMAMVENFVPTEFATREEIIGACRRLLDVA